MTFFNNNYDWSGLIQQLDEQEQEPTTTDYYDYYDHHDTTATPTDTTMGHMSWKVKEEKKGVDIGYTSSNMRPEDGEGCVGKHGIDKDYSFDQVREIAYRMKPRPNIIVKGGKNAKWYLKYFPEETIEHEIEKTSWRWRRTKTKRGCPNHTMYIMTS